MTYRGKIAELFNTLADYLAEARSITNPHQHKTSLSLKFFMATTAVAASISTVTQIFPDLATQSLNDYGAQNGLGENIHQYFNTNNIRVYKRNNPLFAFDEAGRLSKNYYTSQIKGGDAENIFTATVLMPYVYYTRLYNGVTHQYTNSNKAINAYAREDSKPLDKRTCHIYPAANFDLKTVISDFTGLELKKFDPKIDQEKTAINLRRFIIFHEGRHCDQDNNYSGSPIYEADADLYARAIIKATEPDTKNVALVSNMLINFRMVSGGRGGVSHYGSPALTRGSQTPFSSYTDLSVIHSFSNLLANIRGQNEKAFDENTPGAIKRYYIAKALLERDILADNPAMKAMALQYMRAVEFFDKLDQGHQINKDFEMAKIDLSDFLRNYEPAPSRITAASALNSKLVR